MDFDQFVCRGGGGAEVILLGNGIGEEFGGDFFGGSSVDFAFDQVDAGVGDGALGGAGGAGGGGSLGIGNALFGRNFHTMYGDWYHYSFTRRAFSRLGLGSGRIVAFSGWVGYARQNGHGSFFGMFCAFLG